jgi:hypothetical protein
VSPAEKPKFWGVWSLGFAAACK